MKRMIFCGLAAVVLAAPATTGNAVVVQIGDTYEDSANTACTGFAGCSLLFATVPSGKRLVVNSVYCDFYSRNGVLLTARFNVSGGAFGIRPQPMPLSYTGASNTFRYYTAAIPSTRRIIDAGVTPRVSVSGTGSTQIQIVCQLIGALTNMT
jgi:hypothetical protein